MSRSVFVAAFALAVLSAACSPQAAKPADAPPAVAASSCADDGGRLPGTGICAGRAANYLDNPPPNPPAPEGCSWTFNEAVLADSQAVIYRAMTCKGVTTKLGFSAGARSASIDYETSALFGEAAVGETLVRLFTLDEKDPRGGLLRMVKEGVENKEERAACELRDAGYEEWPAGALVVDVNVAYKAKKKITDDEPRTACGPLGIDTGQSTYWLIKQGFAWKFDLGQEQLDIDPRTVTLLSKDADGSWIVVP
ncbi:MAG: hypothetical protein ACOYM8_11535 [Caulobacterales bacterium]|jgi:hypothetical protein